LQTADGYKLYEQFSSKPDLNSLNTKKSWHISLETQVLGWDTQNCDGVKPVNGIPTLLF
jgi:hypothetical protein